MAEYGEWNRKGATLSDVTAKKEYGVDRDFILKGIRAGKLEYREGSIWGNPYLRVLRSQLEKYITEQLGADRLQTGKKQTELRKIKKEMADLKKRLDELQARRTELEKAMKKWKTEQALPCERRCAPPPDGQSLAIIESLRTREVRTCNGARTIAHLARSESFWSGTRRGSETSVE